MRRVHRKKPMDYFLPFLLLLGLGVIVVLGIQLWGNLHGTKGDVYFYTVEGKARVLLYGVKEWENGYSGTKLALGDSLKTSQGGRAVLQFFNGSIIRLGDDTQVTLTQLSKDGDSEKIGVNLDHGMIWVNKARSADVSDSRLEVRTPHMLVTDVGTIFEVEVGVTETTRVLKGSVKANIYDSAQSNQSLDSVDVGVGQEMTLDDAIMRSFANHETPSVLMALNDEFKTTDWYSWNTKEDANPTDFASQYKGGGFFGLTQGDTQSEQSSPETSTATSTQASTPQAAVTVTTQQADFSPELSTPVIVSPTDDARTITKGQLVISGTVSEATSKVVVEQVLAGSPETGKYTLQKYVAGAKNFSYNLLETAGNLKAGINKYTIYAIDKSGKKSSPAVVTITYTKPEASTTQQITQQTTATSEALTAPKVLTFNGLKSSVTTTGVVKVVGEVHGAVKVVVSGLTLQKYVAGSTNWIYYANENGDNLKPGLNEYEVYAIDVDGQESAHTKFTITYNKPEATSTSASTSTSQETSSSQQ